MTSPRIVQQFASSNNLGSLPPVRLFFPVVPCTPMCSPSSNPFPAKKASILHPRVPSQGTRTELVEAEEKDGLVDLEAKDGGLDEAQGLAVDLNEALALLAVCDSSGGLLLAEALDGLNGRHFCGVVTRGVSKGRFGRGGRRWAGRR